MLTTPIQRRSQEAPAPQPQVDSPEFIEQRVDSIEFSSEERPCERVMHILTNVCSIGLHYLSSVWDFLLFTSTPRPAPVEEDTATPSPALAPAPVVEDIVTTYIRGCYHNAPYLTRNFPSLPQKFKDYVYANLSSKNNSLMTWKRQEGMTNNDAFMFLLDKGYIQDYEGLYKIFRQYQREQGQR